MVRVYPLTQKPNAGGMTLYDQEKKRLEQEKLRKSLKKRRKNASSMERNTDAQEAYGTDGGYTSGEELPGNVTTISAFNNQTKSVME